jgi:phosphotransferase system IIB component
MRSGHITNVKYCITRLIRSRCIRNVKWCITKLSIALQVTLKADALGMLSNALQKSSNAVVDLNNHRWGENKTLTDK